MMSTQKTKDILKNILTNSAEYKLQPEKNVDGEFYDSPMSI